MIPIPILSTVISGVTGFFTKKQELKGAKESAAAKLKLSKQDSSANIQLTDAEWESLSVQTQNGSWKDEYITIVITAPIVAIIIGSLWTVVDPETGNAIVSAAARGIGELVALGMDFGLLCSGVVFAAIGLKLWRA